ncbi:hypothetical protein SDJN03_10918, partial [Cucurbita argyrosperma subsp. sororia]
MKTAGLGLFEIKNALKQLDAEFPIHLAYKALCHAIGNIDGKLGEEEIDEFVKYMLSEGYVTLLAPIFTFHCST